MFFAPFGKYQPCGIYTTGHFILLAIAIADIAISLYFALKYLKYNVKTIIRVFAIVMTLFEVIKIGYNFYWGYTAPNNWVPLYFCSLYLYALWLGGFGTKKVEQTGLTFLFGAGILSGLSFAFYPSTSLPNVPATHFLSLYSFFFHGSMVFLGLYITASGHYRPQLKDGLLYMAFTGFFILAAGIVNVAFDANLMFITSPYRIPVLAQVYDRSILLYRILLILALSSFFYITYGIYALLRTARKNQTAA